MTWNNLLVEKDENIAIVAINRPESLNALNAETFHELVIAADAIDHDKEVKVVILTGTGDKAFVAGADIAYMQNMTALEAKEFGLLGQRAMNRIRKLDKPVIAAVNGYALGGGCELAMACDIRIAADTAKFGQPEVNLGVTPGFAGTQRLPRLVGKGIAKEILLTGDIFDAQEAFRIGLVNRVVPEAELMDYARAMAKKIASKSQVAVRLIKEAVNEGLEMDLDKAMAHEANLFGLCFSSEDQKEGMSAFLEKRKPMFRGK
ncbi:MAG: short-chain-enoyl-CoA hydratase [Thermincolia bacterium]